MTKRPGDENPEPPGGRAAERLRDFISQRFPGEAALPDEIDTDQGSDDNACDIEGQSKNQDTGKDKNSGSGESGV